MRPTFVSDQRADRRHHLLDVLRQTVQQDIRRDDAPSLRSYDQALAESRRLAGPEFMHLNARLIREVVSLGGDVSAFVSRRVAERLKAVS